MKDKAIVGNIGHFDNEIDMAGLKKFPGIKQHQHQAAVRPVDVPGRPQRADPGRGPAAEPRLRHRPPELRDVHELHQPGAGPDRAGARTAAQYEKKVYVLPKQLDEKVARLHLDKLGVKLTHADRRSRPPTSACRVGRAVQARPLPVLGPGRQRPTTPQRRHRAVTEKQLCVLCVLCGVVTGRCFAACRRA